MSRSAITVVATLLVPLAFAACNGKSPAPPSAADDPAVATRAPSPAPKAEQGPAEVSFAVMADSRGGSGSVTADGGGGVHEAGLVKALDHVLQQGRARTVMFSGDTVQGGTTADRLAKQLAHWKQLVKPYEEKGLRFYVTSGNHELDDGTLRELEPSRIGQPTAEAQANQRAMLEAFPDLPKNGPPDGGLSYHLRLGDVLVVVIDSYRPGHFHQLDLEWLEQVLSGPARQPGPRAVFVMTHAPAFPVGGHMLDGLANCNIDRDSVPEEYRWPWEKRGAGGPRDVDVDWRPLRDRFWRILSEQKVTALLASHEHNLSCQRIDGVWQIISGGLANHIYPINELPLKMYGGKPQTPRAGDTLWAAASAGYFLVTVGAGGARAEAWGWEDHDAPVKLLQTIDLDRGP